MKKMSLFLTIRRILGLQKDIAEDTDQSLSCPDSPEYQRLQRALSKLPMGFKVDSGLHQLTKM